MEADTLSPVGERDRTQPLVLVVEDDDVIRSVIAEVLEERGFGVRTALNGAEALALLETIQPNVVVLDLLMPVMHGWAFMEEYARKTHGQAIPIVIVSVNPILPRSFDRFGVQRCVGKPFDIDALVGAVTEACAPVAV
jgi:CheY-like chemotaxis protein